MNRASAKGGSCDVTAAFEPRGGTPQ